MQTGTASPPWVRGPARWIVPSLADVFFVAMLPVAVAFGPRMLNADGDLLWHLVIGRFVLAQSRVPDVDHWSYTRANAPFVSHEWLSDATFASMDRIAGLNGVVWIAALAIAVTFWGVARWILGRGVNPYLAFTITLLGAVASTTQWMTRPHVFSLVFTLVFARLLERRRVEAEDTREESASGHSFWLLPLLMALWANAHGAYIGGLALVALHLAGATLASQGVAGTGRRRLTRDLAVTLVLCLAAASLNPSGPALLLNRVQYLANRYIADHTRELASPDFHSAGTWPFAALILIAIATAAWARRPERHVNPAPLFVVLAWTALGLYSVRYIAFFAVTAVPVIAVWANEALANAVESSLPLVRRMARALDTAGQRLARTDRALPGGAWMLLAVAAVSFFLFGMHTAAGEQPYNRFNERIFPIAAVDFLDANPIDGRGFNELDWGGYLLYRRWPSQQVFIDGRTDFYGDAVIREYLQVRQADIGWEDVLARHGVKWILLSPATHLARLLEATPGAHWRRVFRDDTAVIFQRD